jgi:ABC-type oligopeptide transport system substrate-binding subunit
LCWPSQRLRRARAIACSSIGGEGIDGAGNKRDITATTLVPPLGSGPYRIKEFVAGRSIVYERVKDYWSRDLNVNVGQNNFDELRFEYSATNEMVARRCAVWS